MSTTTVTSVDGFHATSTAQRADELVRAFFDAVNADERSQIDELVDRGFLSYDLHGTRSRTGLKRYYSDLRRSFSELHFEVHENVGVLVEGDLVALRTIITGTHTGDYAGVAATGNQIQTSASHMFRVSEDPLPLRLPAGGERVPADPRRRGVAGRPLPRDPRHGVRRNRGTPGVARGVPGRRA